jgi:hypothetical protein
MRAIGIRVKSGFAIAVVVAKERMRWHVERRDEILLTEDAGPYGRFPFHPLIELAGENATDASRRAVAAVRAASKKHLAAFLDSVGEVEAAAIVVGSVIDPKKISNPHIRVHAREGELFRTVVAQAFERRSIAVDVVRDSEIYSKAALKLRRSETQLRAELAKMGRGTVRPWRRDEKVAAAGALFAM